MAKGLGAILVEMAVEERRRKLATLEAPACPVCGEPMTNDGVGWFCYSANTTVDGGGENTCLRAGAISEAFYARKSNVGLRHTDFQGQIIAGVVRDDDIVIKFMTVRGPGGATRFRLDCDCDIEEVPAMIREFGWTWMEWAEEIPNPNPGAWTRV